MDLYSYYEKMLDKAVLEFFPKTGELSSLCFNDSSDLGMVNLPGHLRDDNWMARMFKIHQNLYFTDYSYVLNYVKNSNFFEEQRRIYERKIVAWLIESTINGNEVYEGNYDYFIGSNICDLYFRKYIVDKLMMIGMDRVSIEDGIEYNYELWREQLMELAFNNQFEYKSYYPVFDGDNMKIKLLSLEPTLAEHKKKWLKMRRYEYYHSHKTSVDLYGFITSDMVMTDEEVETLKKELIQMNIDRLIQIEEFKINLFDKNKIDMLSSVVDSEISDEKKAELSKKLVISK